MYTLLPERLGKLDVSAMAFAQHSQNCPSLVLGHPFDAAPSQYKPMYCMRGCISSEHHSFGFSFPLVLTVGLPLPNSVFLMFCLGWSQVPGPWGFLGILFPGFSGVSPGPGPCSLLLFITDFEKNTTTFVQTP